MVQVASTAGITFSACPDAWITCCATKVLLQTVHFFPSVKPVEVQVALTCARISKLCPNAGITCCSTNTPLHSVQCAPSVIPASVQVAALLMSVTTVWSCATAYKLKCETEKDTVPFSSEIAAETSSYWFSEIIWYTLKRSISYPSGIGIVTVTSSLKSNFLFPFTRERSYSTNFPLLLFNAFFASRYAGESIGCSCTLMSAPSFWNIEIALRGILTEIPLFWSVLIGACSDNTMKKVVIAITANIADAIMIVLCLCCFTNFKILLKKPWFSSPNSNCKAFFSVSFGCWFMFSPRWIIYTL